MKCPDCGYTMNHHGDKLLLDSFETDGEYRPQLIEAHSCPNCGANASRTAEND